MLMLNTMSCWNVSPGEGGELDEQAHTATSVTEARLRRMDVLLVEVSNSSTPATVGRCLTQRNAPGMTGVARRLTEPATLDGAGAGYAIGCTRVSFTVASTL
jgi:hypothetical protein